MNVSLWSSKNLLLPEGREQPHIRAIKKGGFSSALSVHQRFYADSLSLFAASGSLGTSTVGLLSMRVTSS